MALRATLGKLAHELIPAPTLGRLFTLKRALKGSRREIMKRLAGRLQSILSPTMYLRVRRIGVKLANRLGRGPRSGSSRAAPASHIRLEQNVTGPFYFRGDQYDTLDALQQAHGTITADMAIASAFLGRHGVLDMMACEATHMPDGYTTLVCLVGSTEEDGAYLADLSKRNPDVLGMLGVNTPVGRKWQSTIDLIRATCDFQLLGITGSDDILPAGLITRIIDRHRVSCSHDSIRPYAASLYGTMEWLIFSDSVKDTLAPQLIKCSYKLESALMPLGAGRFYSRQVMDDFDGDIFEMALSRRLDDKGFYKVHDSGLGVEYYTAQQGAVLSIKGDWGQMNSFETIIQAPTVNVSEFSFEGYEILRTQLTDDTFQRLFGAVQKEHASVD